MDRMKIKVLVNVVVLMTLLRLYQRGNNTCSRKSFVNITSVYGQVPYRTAQRSICSGPSSRANRLGSSLPGISAKNKTAFRHYRFSIARTAKPSQLSHFKPSTLENGKNHFGRGVVSSAGGENLEEKGSFFY
jgi:hypothetical protein